MGSYAHTHKNSDPIAVFAHTHTSTANPSLIYQNGKAIQSLFSHTHTHKDSDSIAVSSIMISNACRHTFSHKNHSEIGVCTQLWKKQQCASGATVLSVRCSSSFGCNENPAGTSRSFSAASLASCIVLALASLISNSLRVAMLNSSAVKLRDISMGRPDQCVRLAGGVQPCFPRQNLQTLEHVSQYWHSGVLTLPYPSLTG